MSTQAYTKDPQPARRSRFARGLAALSTWYRIDAIDRSALQRTFDHQHQRNELSTRIHLALAMLFLAGLAGPTSITEVAGIPLMACALIRLNYSWRTMPYIFRQPTMNLTGLLALWLGLGLVRSHNLHDAIDDIAFLRWAWVIPALWPVMDRKKWLVGALCTGFLIGNMSQLSHALGSALNIDWLTWNRLPNRNSGWWDPVVGGSMLTAALGLHLHAAFNTNTRPKIRILAITGMLVTLLGIFATGTRGAWLAAIALITLVAAASLWSARTSLTGQPKRVLTGCALAAAVIATVWFTAGNTITTRVQETRHELTRAFENNDYSTFTGSRIMMNQWAARAFVQHPVLGVGPGNYKPWVQEQLQSQNIDPSTRSIHDHAHSAYLHLAATVGTPGLIFAGLIVFFGLKRTKPGAGYINAPALALLGLLLAGAFDTIQANAQTSALLMTLLALNQAVQPTSEDG